MDKNELRSEQLEFDKESSQFFKKMKLFCIFS
jgi:hypothetical protein